MVIDFVNETTVKTLLLGIAPMKDLARKYYGTLFLKWMYER